MYHSERNFSLILLENASAEISDPGKNSVKCKISSNRWFGIQRVKDLVDTFLLIKQVDCVKFKLAKRMSLRNDRTRWTIWGGFNNQVDLFLSTLVPLFYSSSWPTYVSLGVVTHVLQYRVPCHDAISLNFLGRYPPATNFCCSRYSFFIFPRLLPLLLRTTCFSVEQYLPSTIHFLEPSLSTSRSQLQVMLVCTQGTLFTLNLCWLQAYFLDACFYEVHDWKCCVTSYYLH